MPFNHEAVAALPVGAPADKALERAMAVRRMIYPLAASEDAADFAETDPASGIVPLYLMQNSLLFEFDPLDTTTAADGITCLVTAGSKRYKLQDITRFLGLLTFDDIAGLVNTSQLPTSLGSAKTVSTSFTINAAVNNGLTVTDGTVTGIMFPSTILTHSLAIGTTTAHPVVFMASNAQRGEITAGGRLLWGTTADTGQPVQVLGAIGFQGATSGSTGLIASAIASGTLTLPAGTDTLVGLTLAQALTNKTINASSNTISNLTTSMFATNVVDNDTALTANSSTRLPTQAAVKAYVDALIAAADAMVFKGVIDCSANPNYPAADRGWTYKVSVAGKIGGASGTNVEVGDTLLCITDGTASGTQAAVGANWNIVQANLDGAVTGPASSTSGNIATFNGTGGKVIQDGGKALPSGAIVGTIDTQTLTGKTFDTAGAGNSLLINGLAATANTGTGAVARATSPTFVTPVLGAATATTITVPLVAGGAGAGDSLTLESTSGSGTTDKVVIKTGSQVIRATIDTNGLVAFGPTAPVTGIRFDINPTATSVPPPTGTTPVVRAVADGGQAILALQAFGGASQGGVFRAAQALGSAASPTQVTAGTQLFNLSAQAYNDAGAYNGPGARIAMFALNNQTTTDSSAYITVATTPSGTGGSGANLVQAAKFHASGSLIVGTSTTADGGAATILPTPQTFASLPAASATNHGALANVTDSTTATWGATVTGGGSNSVQVRSNGINWTVVGK